MIAFIDQCGEIFEAADFTQMYSNLGQSAIHPGLLAIAMLLQHAEGLSDRQASERMQDSLMWKYALRLDVDEPGWDPSVYVEFRNRLLQSGSVELILDKMLHVAEQYKLLDTSKQRTDATHILSAAKLLNRVELLHECVFDCLNELLKVNPKFVMRVTKTEWHDRYFKMRPYNYKIPKTDAAQKKLADTIGSDASYLLTSIDVDPDHERLSKQNSVLILRRVVQEQFDINDDGPSLKDGSKLGPTNHRLSSPDDPDATWGRKRGLSWLGYKVHFSETYGPNTPHLITNVHTTPAHVNDCVVLGEIHAQLKSKGHKPKVHLLDGGYAHLLTMTKSARDEIDVLAPLTNGHSWQSKAGKGLDIHQFTIDWEQQKVTCPSGETSKTWKNVRGDEGEVAVSFSADSCKMCPLKVDCTTSHSRKLHFKAKPLYEFLEEHRKRQKTGGFWKEFANRSGVEGTISQVVRIADARRSPYFGTEKVHLKNVLAAAAVNALRLGNWFLGIRLAKTRRSRFEMLMAPSAA
jgi:transposase